MLFGISPPLSLYDLFNTWSKRGNKNLNALLLIAAAALTWTVWLTRNEVIFDKSRPKSFLQVLFRGTHWFRQWAQLQRCEALRNELVSTGQYLETSALKFFSSSGWLSTRFITSS